MSLCFPKYTPYEVVTGLWLTVLRFIQPQTMRYYNVVWFIWFHVVGCVWCFWWLHDALPQSRGFLSYCMNCRIVLAGCQKLYVFVYRVNNKYWKCYLTKGIIWFRHNSCQFWVFLDTNFGSKKIRHSQKMNNKYWKSLLIHCTSFAFVLSKNRILSIPILQWYDMALKYW